MTSEYIYLGNQIFLTQNVTTVQSNNFYLYINMIIAPHEPITICCICSYRHSACLSFLETICHRMHRNLSTMIDQSRSRSLDKNYSEPFFSMVWGASAAFGVGGGNEAYAERRKLKTLREDIHRFSQKYLPLVGSSRRT